jgi:hypothetical protein
MAKPIAIGSVYVVIFHDWEETPICSVWTSRAKAEAEAQRLKECDRQDAEHYLVDEHLLNVPGKARYE